MGLIIRAVFEGIPGQVVLLPVCLGAFLNQTFPAQMEKTAPFAPLLAVLMTVRLLTSQLWTCRY